MCTGHSHVSVHPRAWAVQEAWGCPAGAALPFGPCMKWLPLVCHLPPCLQVARLARKLPLGDLSVQAAQLGGSGSGAFVAPVTEAGEEDLT
jgi:hypothetical protein